MAKFVKPLTETRIKNLKPKATPYGDGNNLFLHVYNAEKKTFIFWYVHPITKKRTKRKIGEYPYLSLENAREKARAFNKLISQGLDPFEYLAQQAEMQARQEITLLEFAPKWRDLKLAKGENKPATMAREYRRLENHLFPIFGHCPINQITKIAVIDAFFEMYATKGDTVEKVIGRFVEIMDYAVEFGIIEANPLSTIQKTFKRKKDKPNPTINAKDLPALFKRLNLANNFITSKLLVEWQMLTMLRSKEAVSIEWAEIDWHKKLLVIPAEKMKGTLKNPRPHTVPLSTQALALLKEMKKHNGHRRHVFANRLKPDEPCNSQTANSVLKRNGYHGILTAHGLRAMARTYLADQGIDFQVAEACLAHLVGGDVSRRYNYSDYLELRRQAMQMWGDYVEQCKKS